MRQWTGRVGPRQQQLWLLRLCKRKHTVCLSLEMLASLVAHGLETSGLDCLATCSYSISLTGPPCLQMLKHYALVSWQPQGCANKGCVVMKHEGCKEVSPVELGVYPPA